MSGYRTIKRALGETNLERKCRVFFGLCLALLITATFIWVEYNAERVVLEATRAEGRGAAANHLLRTHWKTWANETIPAREATLNRISGDLAKTPKEYKYRILALDKDEVGFVRAEVPQDPAELEIVKGLHEQLEAARAERQLAAEPAADLTVSESIQEPSIFREIPRPEIDKYLYYTPIIYNSLCFDCHSIGGALHAIPAAEAVSTALVHSPSTVMEVTIPYEATRRAINRARAGLIGAAILTVFLAMVALYVIVRYVIVKPLKHLRDVSEEVSQGNTKLRAEIHTNDEFEELAHAFNRMLRHMTDAQAELRQLNESLDAKVDELAQVNMRLYDMNRLKSDFLANMSHELRTPLNSIIGFSEVLQGIDSLNDKQRRYAQNIQKSGRVLLEMINDILDLAKLEAGKMELKPSEFRLASVVASQCDMVRPLAEERNIDLSVLVEHADPVCYQDQIKVQQILTNLLSNAIKFTPEGGRITVEARKHDDELWLIVADTGVGIPEEDRDVIFEKFRQSAAVLDNDGLTREHAGTGLGLSIVRELCKLLGGEVSFESELGQGSTFKIALPWDLTDKPRFSAELHQKLAELVRPDPEELREKAVRPVA